MSRYDTSTSSTRTSTSNPAATGEEEDESLFGKIKRMTTNCGHSTGLCCFKAKQQTQIQGLEYKVSQRQKQFGVDYMTLVESGASAIRLDVCMQQAKRDLVDIRNRIDARHDKIGTKTEKVQEKIKTAPIPSNDQSSAEDGRGGVEHPAEPAKHNNGPFSSDPQPAGQAKNSKNAAAPSSPKKSKASQRLKKEKKQKPPKAPISPSKQKDVMEAAADLADNEFGNADPSRWQYVEQNFDGSSSHATIGKQEQVKGASIPKAMEKFKANPSKYVAMTYQANMKGWPEAQQQYVLIHRAGTTDYTPKNVSDQGWMTVLLNNYQRLPPFKDNLLPKQYRDDYTDRMYFNGKRLHSKTNIPILPGRGMGCCDAPNLKIIGDVDPSDIAQGSVGNCWLLSGISSLAEFDGAVKRLFRKTKNLDAMPRDGPNMYTITLWDLATWKEVDIRIDERLCASVKGGGPGILASKPSEDGELWVCYLEKALAAHCGGWDKISGGQCTHAWALLTGCKEQYSISKNKATGKYQCIGKFNPDTEQWAKHTNSPHDCEQGHWKMPWPAVGGGGDDELDEKELFRRMCAWDDTNYIVGAGTTGISDEHSTGGMVDNHAYSVITSLSGVAGTNVDLVKVRNPWGKGEIEDGEFDDDGPGWDRFPQIKKQLKPVVADDGIFWLTRKEFFQFFGTVYLSASDMTEFLED